MIGLPYTLSRRKYDDMLGCFDTIQKVTDGQTDKRTDGQTDRSAKPIDIARQH